MLPLFFSILVVSAAFARVLAEIREDASYLRCFCECVMGLSAAFTVLIITFTSLYLL